VANAAIQLELYLVNTGNTIPLPLPPNAPTLKDGLPVFFQKEWKADAQTDDGFVNFRKSKVAGSADKTKYKDFIARVQYLNNAGAEVGDLCSDLHSIKKTVDGNKANVTDKTSVVALDSWAKTGVRPAGAKDISR
jgi:hypothetical protein